MPGWEAAEDYAELRRQEAAAPKLLYALDARTSPSATVSDVDALMELATTAVCAAGGHVLDAGQVVFPNGAITLILVLAESHLSIHTWPEENLIAIDLFSCGAINGRAIISELAGKLALTAVSIRQLERGLPPAP